MVSISGTAGCLSRIPGVEANQVSVAPETPEELSDATSPGEFYYLLEENGISVSELYHDQNDETLSLFYDSEAETTRGSNEEIGLIYQTFELVVEHGSDLQGLYTEIVDPFEGQAEGWGVEREWVDKYLEEEITEEQLWQTIVQTKDFGEDDESDEDSGEEMPTDGNEDGDGGDDTNGDTDGDEDGTDDEEEGDDDTDEG